MKIKKVESLEEARKIMDQAFDPQTSWKFTMVFETNHEIIIITRYDDSGDDKISVHSM